MALTPQTNSLGFYSRKFGAILNRLQQVRCQWHPNQAPLQTPPLQPLHQLSSSSLLPSPQSDALTPSPTPAPGLCATAHTIHTTTIFSSQHLPSSLSQPSKSTYSSPWSLAPGAKYLEPSSCLCWKLSRLTQTRTSTHTLTTHVSSSQCDVFLNLFCVQHFEFTFFFLNVVVTMWLKQNLCFYETILASSRLSSLGALHST